MLQLFCPVCREQLIFLDLGYKCANGHINFMDRGGVLINSSVINEKDKSLYDKIYSAEHGQDWLQGLNRQNFAKRLLEEISLAYRRERFFRRRFKGHDNLILDIACGAGRDYFKRYGRVVGIDLALEPLRTAKQRYDLVMQSGVDSLPFADNTFDYVVSSDFFGHVRNEDKDKIIGEIFRVLKPGGQAINIIETDSDNILFKIAHRDPGLFKKYFVDQIGGHIGLELPTECVKRWKNDGFEIIKVKKIWGTVWPIQYYADLFGAEYPKQSSMVKYVVMISKILGKNKLVQVMLNILLNPINLIVEVLTPLNHGAGLMMVCQKKQF